MATLRLVQAQMRLEQGDAQGAQAALALLPKPGFLSTTTPGTGATQDAEPNTALADPALLRGRALCALGQPAQGLDLQRQRIGSLAASLHAASPDLAHARALPGWCALQAGKRGDATELAAQAQVAFDQQPDVSPYCKQPLLALQQRLGLRTGAKKVAQAPGRAHAGRPHRQAVRQRWDD